jgi:hypothetical protein
MAWSGAAAPSEDERAVMHSMLGLGGRALELSLGRGMPIEPSSFELAVDELHSHVLERTVSADELREAARWLIGLPGVERMPAAALQTVRGDLAALAR